MAIGFDISPQCALILHPTGNEIIGQLVQFAFCYIFKFMNIDRAKQLIFGSEER